MPHGIWPSGDGTLVYVGLENGDRLVAIDTLNNKLIASSPIGQASQAIVYVPDAVPNGNGTQGLQSLVSMDWPLIFLLCRRTMTRQ
jgi:DNA-binding beta-propeller fold protein YncE